MSGHENMTQTKEFIQLLKEQLVLEEEPMRGGSKLVTARSRVLAASSRQTGCRRPGCQRPGCDSRRRGQQVPGRRSLVADPIDAQAGPWQNL